MAFKPDDPRLGVLDDMFDLDVRFGKPDLPGDLPGLSWQCPDPTDICPGTACECYGASRTDTCAGLTCKPNCGLTRFAACLSNFRCITVDRATCHQCITVFRTCIGGTCKTCHTCHTCVNCGGGTNGPECG
jgi:hypothetical protein